MKFYRTLVPLFAIAFLLLPGQDSSSWAQSIPAADPAGPALEVDPMDWPMWRGPEQNGISRETGLPESWTPETELWDNDEAGGISTPIVMQGKVYTIVRDQPGTKRQSEKVICLDAATGEKLWENRFNVFLSDVPDTRVGWSNLVGDPTTGRVYVLGVCDFFRCIDGQTGQTVWSRSLSEEFGMINTYGGRTNVPVVFEDLVIISGVTVGWGELAKPAHRFFAFDKATGEIVWVSQTRLFPYDTTYSTPILAVLAGQQAMVFGSSDGAVWALQPRTGQPIWQYQLARRGLNATVLVAGDKVYTGHSEENRDDNTMGAIVALDGSLTGDITQTGELWRVKEVGAGRAAPLMIGDRVYFGIDSGSIQIVDSATGEPIARRPARLAGTILRSSPLYADGRIYAATTDAWHVLEPNDEGVRIAQRQRLRNEEIYGSIVASHGRIYVPTTRRLVCLAKPDAGEPQATERPAPPEENPVADDQQPAHLQLVPAETLVKPGEIVQFRARLFNSKGQFLEERDAEYSLEGAGEIGADGQFTAGSMPSHQATIVTATIDGITGQARIRAVPPLPWEFDFSDGVVPVSWVGCRYRNIVLDFDLLQSLRQRDETAAGLYIYLMTTFTNTGQPTATFVDTPAGTRWRSFLIYFGLENEITTLDQAKQAFDAGLQMLADEQVIGGWNWNTAAGGNIQFSATRGPRQMDGNPVMTKITTIPLGTRSQGWLGATDLLDYTIQADVQGGTRNGLVPDIGLIAQRYTLDMMGASQQLQIRTWTPQLQMAVTVPFQWQPDVWYTMKFRAGVEDGKAVLRGKAWPRDAEEPAEWTVEAVDDMPNVEGSPGLFGNAVNAEIFIDNIRITPN